MQKYLILIIPFLMACTTQPEECGSGHSDINGKCYHQSDLDVLQDFIDNSSGSIISNLDTDSSGSIEPLELQIQKWNENGRLTFLWLYDDSLSGEIPESIGKLTFLDTLNLSYNQLTGKLPKSIGRLAHLNWLYIMEPIKWSDARFPLHFLSEPHQYLFCIQPVLPPIPQLYSFWENRCTGHI